MSTITTEEISRRIIGAEQAGGITLGMPNALYHAAPGVSNSMLGEADPTPAHLVGHLQRKEADKDEAEEETPEHFLIGNLVHHAMNTPDDPLPSLVLPPATYPDSETGKEKPWNWNSNFAKDWRKRRIAEGKLVIKKPRTLEIAKGCVRSILRHPIASRYFQDGVGEVSVFNKHITDHGTITTRARMDWLPRGHTAMVDIKTTTAGGASDEAFAYTLHDFGYYRQAAHYLGSFGKALLIEQESGRPLDDWMTERDHFVFIVVEKVEPFAVNVFYVDPQALQEGREDLCRRLDSIAKCCYSGEWPAYPPELRPINLPGRYYANKARKAGGL